MFKIIGFFLLAEGSGGTKTNDNGFQYNVVGIGKQAASAITYRSLTMYMGNLSNYQDARNNSIFAAMDLYGECSNELLQVVNAWDAVGVNSSTGFGYNLAVNCLELNFFHDGSHGLITVEPQPYTARVINDLTADCAISSNGQPVTFIAGNSITIAGGFTSGSNFQGTIDPCLSAALRSNSDENNYELTNLKKSDSILSIAKEILIFPNPTSGMITIDPNGLKISNISIRDILGQLIYEDREKSNTFRQVDLSDNIVGMYLIRITTDQGVKIFKIALQ